MQVRPYLTFKNNCNEAIELYKRAFNAEVSEIMRFSDIPQSGDNCIPMPDSYKNLIIQATLQFDNNFIRLSDCPEGLNDTPSDTVSIIVECSIDETRHAFAVLSEEGKVGSPLQETFYSPCTGVVHDKFGVMWILMALTEK